MKSIAFILSLFFLNSFAATYSIDNNFGFLQDVRFELYTSNLPMAVVPDGNLSSEDVLMYDVIRAVKKNGKWTSYTLNKSLLGTYKVGSPTIIENNNGKKIFFIANFPGTKGGTDLYMSEFLEGEWTKPKNLGSKVNTVNNESNTGMLDENTLTFSSNGIIKKMNINTLEVEDFQNVAGINELPKTTVTTTVVEPVKEKVVETTSNTVVEPIKETVAETTTVINETKEEVKPTIIEPIVENTTKETKKDKKDKAKDKAKDKTSDKVVEEVKSEIVPYSEAVKETATKVEEVVAPTETKVVQETKPTIPTTTETKVANETKPIIPTTTETKVVQETKPTTTTISGTINENGVLNVGKMLYADAKTKFPLAIQVGAFMNPNWKLINQLANIGQITTFQNESNLNVVWLTGFTNRDELNQALAKTKANVNFKNAFILK